MGLLLTLDLAGLLSQQVLLVLLNCWLATSSKLSMKARIDKLKTAIHCSLSEENTAEELQALAEKLIKS